MALPLHPIGTYSWLKWKLWHLLFAHLCHTVPRCIPLSLCPHAGSYNSCYFQPFLLRENNSVSCWYSSFALNQREHVKAVEFFLIMSQGLLVLFFFITHLLGLNPAWVLRVYSGRDYKHKGQKIVILWFWKDSIPHFPGHLTHRPENSQQLGFMCLSLPVKWHGKFQKAVPYPFLAFAHLFDKEAPLLLSVPV